MSKKSTYRILFYNDEDLCELYAGRITDSDIFGFLEIEEIIFGENHSEVINPAEERLKHEFEKVECTFIPTHNIIRIDKVEKPGNSKLKEISGGRKVTQLPAAFKQRSNKNEKDL